MGASDEAELKKYFKVTKSTFRHIKGVYYHPFFLPWLTRQINIALVNISLTLGAKTTFYLLSLFFLPKEDQPRDWTGGRGSAQLNRKNGIQQGSLLTADEASEIFRASSKTTQVPALEADKEAVQGSITKNPVVMATNATSKQTPESTTLKSGLEMEVDASVSGFALLMTTENTLTEGSGVGSAPAVSSQVPLPENSPTASSEVTMPEKAPAANTATGAGSQKIGLGSNFVYPAAWRRGQIPKFPQGKINLHEFT
jgi:hypothetical protein